VDGRHDHGDFDGGTKRRLIRFSAAPLPNATVPNAIRPRIRSSISPSLSSHACARAHFERWTLSSQVNSRNICRLWLMGLAMVHARILTIAVACAVLGLTACGGGGNGAPPLFTTQILSDPAFDGDIEQISPTSFTITQGMSPTVQTVLAGIDPVAGTEFRAFLDFPLTGSGGVPGNAGIDSAFLDIFIDDLQPVNGTLPILIDLVSFQPPTLIATDFDRTQQPALASTRISPPISPADVGMHVSVDVTALMIEAQRLGLPDFQVRVMEDLGPPIYALMSVDDTTGPNRSARAPLLTVTYF
jgi:hypothetical protein